MNAKLDKKKNDLQQRVTATITKWSLLKLRILRNLAERRLEPIFDDSKPRDERSVHRDKSSQE